MEQAETTEMLAQMKAEMAQMKAQLAVIQQNEMSGLDYMTAFGQDDKEMPIVPIGDGGGMFAWDETKKQIGAGGVMVGGHWVSVAASSENLGNGSYAVKVTLGAAADTAEIAALGVDSDTVRYIPIYRVENGKVTGDMRWSFVVQCWE